MKSRIWVGTGSGARTRTVVGSIPLPEELSFEDRTAPRGRVARALARRSSEAAGAQVHGRSSPPALEDDGWYRVSIGEGAEVSLRHDHPAARSAATRRRLGDALGRTLREASLETEP